MNLHLLYPRYVEFKKVDEVFARRCILRAYENLKSISRVSRLFRITGNKACSEMIEKHPATTYVVEASSRSGDQISCHKARKDEIR